MPDTNTNSSNSQSERCARCGEAVAVTDELCPNCGAVLAAYRTAETVATPVPPPPIVPQLITPRREQQPAVEPEMRSIGPETSEELRTARAALLAVLVASERRLMALVDSEPNLVEPAPSTVEPGPIPQPMPERSPATEPGRVDKLPRPVTRPQVSPKVRTGQRGFVANAPVEPVLLVGALLFAIAVGLVVCASLASLESLAIVAFFLGAVGIFAMVIAVLAVLVQRDRRRN